MLELSIRSISKVDSPDHSEMVKRQKFQVVKSRLLGVKTATNLFLYDMHVKQEKIQCIRLPYCWGMSIFNFEGIRAPGNSRFFKLRTISGLIP